MKNKFITVAIALVVIGVISALVYSENQKNEKVASGISEKVYVAIEGSGEIAVIDTKKIKTVSLLATCLTTFKLHQITKAYG